MDVKGITWVGNIYQKFEAMCLEVEEIMYQDTVKFVENQVQTVGASVKKFCSEVVEDMLPPSCIDSDKVTAPEFSVVRCNDVQVCKKVKVCRKREPAKAIYQLSEDSKILGDVKKDVLRAPRFRGTSCADNTCQTPFQVSALQKASPDLHSGSTDDKSVPESAITVNENSGVNSMPSAETSKVIAPGEPEFIGFLTENDESAHDQTTIASSASVEINKGDTMENHINNTERGSRCAPESSGNGALLNKLISDQSLATCERETKTPSTSGVPLVESYVYFSDIEADSVDSSTMSENICSRYVFPLPGCSNGSRMNTTKGDFDTEQDAATFNQIDKAKLEESCIVVNNDEIHFVARREGKHRSYKKKVRDAFSSKKKSSRILEYEQLATWHGVDAEPSKDCRRRSRPTLNLEEEEKTQAHDYSEPEWELL
ncbi:uncharacterized protein LOC115732137 [Rhodamnia argentea]|uniref:Uncharacterized protein LOC115732137 n=1 Tax=Rhodamnia argentea TaxID=178133 RepID=A0A8B8N8B9_9MYRT|nr:uncharacterized protein LOC115732137 [Rhodamnia argentea]XP_030518667.1 uncharacterized protein LOC115732137 [Rhodamnia argentea]XP_048127031.1 uncharacterized protein LOC115732137 [Rhodamnia argentea]